jgi:putative FmdB family regulatory protein
MPIYNYKCYECNTEFESFSTIKDREIATCSKCGKKAKKLFIGKHCNIFDPFKPYWSENISNDNKPVLIGSRAERKRLLKERHLEILPEKKRKYRDCGNKIWVTVP